MIVEAWKSFDNSKEPEEVVDNKIVSSSKDGNENKGPQKWVDTIKGLNNIQEEAKNYIKQNL